MAGWGFGQLGPPAPSPGPRLRGGGARASHVSPDAPRTEAAPRTERLPDLVPPSQRLPRAARAHVVAGGTGALAAKGAAGHMPGT